MPAPPSKDYQYLIIEEEQDDAEVHRVDPTKVDDDVDYYTYQNKVCI